MKRLLIASDSFLPRWDGVARFLSEIIPELSREYRITVVAPSFKGFAPQFDNVKLERLPMSRLTFGDITFASWSYKRIKELVQSADIVWTHTIGPVGMATIRAARKCKKHLIAYVHSIEWELTSNSVAHFKSLVYVAVRKIARFLYNRFDLIIVPTREVARILQFNKIKKPKVVVYLGVKSDTFKPAEKKAAAKKAIGIDPGRFVIGYSGRLGREKDLPNLFRAFVRLDQRYPHLSLLLVGEGVPALKESLKRRNVILPGAKDNVVSYLQAMDVYVLPSLTETSSLSTMEAMSCGIPVIATKVGFVKFYVKEGENGMLIPKRDSLTLYTKLDRLINGEALRRKMGAAARKTIIEKHQWKTTVQRIRKVLAGF